MLPSPMVDNCLKDKREDYQNFLCCIVHSGCAEWYAHIHTLQYVLWSCVCLSVTSWEFY